MVPLYGVYSLLFTDSGLGAAEVSSLFVVWSVAGFAFEVPSGAWADVVDRRMLLVLSALLNGAAWVAWVVQPTYPGFAAGFVLWALSSALTSGTFESLLYDELAAREAAARFPSLLGWAESSAMTANLVATFAAVPLFAWGGYPLVGLVSVATALAQVLLAAVLPVTGHRTGRQDDPEEQPGPARYLSTLRSGIHEAAASPPVRRLLLLVAVVVGASAYDEYFPLVAREHGADTATAAVLVAVTVLGQMVGTAAAGRTAGMTGRALGWAVAAAAVLVSAGVLVPPVVGFALIALGYGLLSNAMIVSEARLQDAISGPARATVTSVSGLGTETVALSVYVYVAVLAGLLPLTVLVALLGVPLALSGWWLARALRPGTPRA